MCWSASKIGAVSMGAVSTGAVSIGAAAGWPDAGVLMARSLFRGGVGVRGDTAPMNQIYIFKIKTSTSFPPNALLLTVLN
jgi:hypothetical protein